MQLPDKLQAAVLIFFIVNVLFTFLSNTGAYGKTNKQVSDDDYTLITPPGWAFAIWGLIFMWEGVACVAAAIPRFKDFTRKVVDEVFVGAWGVCCLSQALWSIIVAHSVQVAAFFIMVIFAALLVMQQRSLHVLQSAPVSQLPWIQRYGLYALLVAPFSIHLGWILAASTLNVSLAAVASMASATTLLAVAIGSLLWIAAFAWWVGVAGTLYAQRGDVAMVAAVMWALNAISSHERRPINTSTGPYVYSDLIQDAISLAAKFGTGMLGVGMALAIAVSLAVGFLRPVAPPSSKSTNVPDDATLAAPLIKA